MRAPHHRSLRRRSSESQSRSDCRRGRHDKGGGRAEAEAKDLQTIRCLSLILDDMILCACQDLVLADYERLGINNRAMLYVRALKCRHGHISL